MTTIEQVVSYNDARARRDCRAEATEAINQLTRIIADLDAGRVPSNTYPRTAAAAIADVARAVGQIATYDEVRKALATERES